MSLSTSRSSHARRAWLAAALAALIGLPGGVVPPPATLAAPAPLSALDGSAPGEDDLVPSIQYRHAEEHAADALEFEPGERVTVPFTPGTTDDWEIDGRRSQALPAGHATGQQMLEGARDSTWAAGPPSDLALPSHFGRLGPRSIDPGSVDAGPARAELASFVTGPSDGPAAQAPVSPSGLRREIFGFLPYWELADKSTVLDWRVLSTLAYFSVGCTSSGSLAKRNADGSTTTGWAGWTSRKMTSIIDAAHENHTRVVLTVSCFAWSSTGAATQAALLGSPAARSNLARQVAAAVRDRGADGVNLDFEPIVSGYSDEFTKLVRAVRSALNAVAPGYQLTFDTMGSIGDQPIVEATASGGADAVFIMGYDYRTAGASVAGSISPLSGPVYDLTDTVRAYTARISPSKIILGVPWYGRAWSTPTDDLHGQNISGAKYGNSAEPVYAQAVALAAAYGRRYDAVEESPWTRYRKETCTAAHGCVTSWRQLYYDDASSLNLRYDLINRSNLRGVGIWALGYDNALPELRAALRDKFLADRTPPLTGVAALGQAQRDEGFRVAWTSWDDSAITGYDVQASVDGGPFATWLAGTKLSSSIFLGTHGRTYAFRVRATDVHGNVSAWKPVDLGSLGTRAGLARGGFATVVTDGLQMRTSPSTSASVMTTLDTGNALRVIGGPASGEGYTWYQVAGPIRQWPPVEAPQVGGWVAASGNGETNVVPRRPVHATRIDAGLTSLRLADGGPRVLTPNGDGSGDTLSIDWLNRRAFDRVALRVFRSDGSLAGTDVLGTGKADAGATGFTWDGRLGGALVPPGAYVIQLQGVAGSTTWSVPSASPVNGVQLGRFGVVVGPAAPTSVVSFKPSPASPTNAKAITYNLRFGGPVKWLSAADIGRGGTAMGCKVGAPTGFGATWAVVVRGCRAGTLVLAVKAQTVVDSVSNWGPASQVNTPALVIDRSAPSSSAPRTTLRSGATLASISTGTGIPATLTWSATDAGGAGLATYDVARSRDGGPFNVIATGLTSRSLAMSLPPGHAYRFEVRPHDRAGNVGGWKAGATIRPSHVQQTNAGIAYGGTWRLGEGSHYSAEGVRFATAAGATAKVSFTGRGIAFVTTRGPDRGAVRVYVDGQLVGTVDTHSPSLRFREVVFSRTWASSGFHTLRLVVVGTPGRPRVDLDAFEILR